MEGSIERDVIDVYPPREIDCTAGDLEMAISILEEYIKIKDKLWFVMPVQLKEEKTLEMIIKTFMLAAESMKGNLKLCEGLKVQGDRFVRFY